MSTSSLSARTTWANLSPYVVAVLTLVVATVLRMALNPVLGDRQAFMTYMAAVIFTAWLGGRGPSLLVLLVSPLLAAWFFIPPKHSLAVTEVHNYIAVCTFLALGVPIVALGTRLGWVCEQALRSEQLHDTQVHELDGDRKRLQYELSQLGEELRTVDRRREDFFALVADELRRPLVPIASAASFHSIAATASEMESAMDIVKHETTQLGRLIDDLLDAFRNSQGNIKLRRERLDLAAVGNCAIETMRTLAAQSGRELNISLSKEPVWVEGDAFRLERVIYNLLMNAVRCTNPGGQIWITICERQGTAVVKVKDTGIGLSPDAIARIFQLGSQVDRSLPRDRGGMGISLLAVKPLVEIHGGTVTVHSDGPNQGCEFVISLPISGPTASPTAPNDGAGEVPRSTPDTSHSS